MPTPIAIRALSKHYRAFAGAKEATDGSMRAVDAVSLDIAPGELFFLLGPSGCGKTTLLRMIAGFIKPTSGSLEFAGRDVTHLAPNKRNTGMVFQSYALWPHMTVAQNVAFGLSVRKVPKEEREKRALEALRAVHMEDLARRKPTQLSGGQQQRVALARALVVKPDVLLLDEPLSNLDAKLRLEMRTEIKRICAETKITTVYVTHDQKEALSMADRIGVMNRGHLIQIGSPRELYSHPRSRFVADFLGDANFLQAQVISRTGDTVRLNTPGGEIESRIPPTTSFDPPKQGVVLCSIRPEAITLNGSTSHNALSAKMLDTMYLGDTVQHLVELPGGARMRVSRLHANAEPAIGAPVSLAIAPEDVVLLAD